MADTHSQVTRRQFLAATPGVLATASLAPAILADAVKPSAGLAAQRPSVGRSSRPATAPGGDVTSITSQSSKSFRILQITDLHLFEKSGEVNEPTKLDRATYEDCRKYVDLHKPDLLVISGDWWYEDPHGRCRAALDWGIKQQDALGVPWAFCWGNHDLASDYRVVHDLLEHGPRCLYRGGATHGDYRIEVHAAGAKATDPPALDLLLMNSSNIGLTAWQVDWYRRAVRAVEPRVPALAFFHIPLLQFDTLYRAAQTPGARLEKVCFEKEDGTTLPLLAQNGTLRACFCGHDHINDYAVRGDGVDLVYGRATGHSGYGGDKLPKSAKLIDVDLASAAYKQMTVLADGKTWVPTIQHAG